jgi:hypothetical protein
MNSWNCPRKVPMALSLKPAGKGQLSDLLTISLGERNINQDMVLVCVITSFVLPKEKITNFTNVTVFNVVKF